MKIETGIKHTPGPWTIQRDYRYDQDAFSIEKRGNGLRSVIALTNDSWLCEEHGDLVKNTRLLAAAPDLLWCLNEAVSTWEYIHRDENHQTGITPEPFWLTEARSAIRKATE